MHEPERTEPEHERSGEQEPEQITFAEAGRRLGRSADAVRMAANRGAVVTVSRGGRRWVIWPQPEQGEHEHERSAERESEQPEPRARSPRDPGAGLAELVAQLQADLADARADRDHWRDQAERLVMLMQADRAVALQDSAGVVEIEGVAGNAAVTHSGGPGRAEPGREGVDTLRRPSPRQRAAAVGRRIARVFSLP